MIPRSVLITPGDGRDMLAKALGSDADAVVFDLEDAVAPADQDAAREAVADALSGAPPDRTVGVRISRGGEEADLDAVLGGREPDYLVVPDTEDPGTIERLAARLEGRGSDARLRPTIETARGLQEAPAIAAAPRVEGIGFGGEDMRTDLGVRVVEGDELDYARGRIVVAAAAADVGANDTVYIDVTDLEGLRAEAERAARLGFDGKSAIHPDQVAVINDAFTPSPAEAERARRIVRGFEDADGNAVRIDDEMVDPPVYERAVRTVERARSAGVLDGDGGE